MCDNNDTHTTIVYSVVTIAAMVTPLQHLQVGVVTGDDLMPQKNDLLDANLCDLISGLPLPPSAHSINAYLG